MLFGLEEANGKACDLFRPGALPGLLPAGVYRFANAPHDTRLAAFAFALGSYRFNRYRKADAPDVTLVPPEGIDAADIARMADAAWSPAISSIRRPTTWDRRNWRRPQNSLRRALAQASTASSAMICKNRIFHLLTPSAWHRPARRA